MADAKLTALTAASALAGADLFYISQGGVSKKATHTQLLTLVGTTYVPLAGGTMTGALTLPAGAVGAPSLMFTGAGATTGLYSPAADQISISAGGVQQFWVNAGGSYSTGNVLGLYNDTGYISLGTSLDVRIYRDTSAVLSLRNGTASQTFRLYNTYTDSSNYERLTLTGVAGTSVNITAETLGTGGDNIDIVLTPAGTGAVRFPTGAYISQPGTLYTPNAVIGGHIDLDYYSNGLSLSVDLGFGFKGGVVSSAVDTALFRNAAGVVEVNNGTAATYRDLKLRNLIQTEYSQLTEMTAPSAPATNSVRIYAEDNGAGKTRLMALFATGSAVQLGIEP